MKYQYHAASIDGFVSQVVRYVSAGYVFYHQARVPEKKDPVEVVERRIAALGIKSGRWRRERRNLKDAAGVHVLLHGRVFVVLLTKGRHDAFYETYGFRTVKAKNGKKVRVQVRVPDMRNTGLKVFGYAIRLDARQKKVNVRLDEETRRKVTSNMLARATWDCYRDPQRLEREFRRLPYQPYGPVYRELKLLVEKVNKRRRARGFRPIGLDESVSRFKRACSVFRKEELVESGVSEEADPADPWVALAGRWK